MWDIVDFSTECKGYNEDAVNYMHRNYTQLIPKLVGKQVRNILIKCPSEERRYLFVLLQRYNIVGIERFGKLFLLQ